MHRVMQRKVDCFPSSGVRGRAFRGVTGRFRGEIGVAGRLQRRGQLRGHMTLHRNAFRTATVSPLPGVH